MDVNAAWVTNGLGNADVSGKMSLCPLETRIREWALPQIKIMQMPANKLLLKYQKLKSYCFVVLHLCSFTHFPSLLFLPLFKKMVPSFLCVSISPVGGGPAHKVK